MNTIKKFSSVFITLFMLCTCGTHHIDEKYAAAVVKDKLALPGNLSAKKLSGGFSGTMNFLVTNGGKKYVVRFLEKGTYGKREIYNFKIASDEGYGPHVYFSDPSQAILIMEYLSDKTITSQDLQSDEECIAMAHLLQKIHRGKAFKNSGFDVFKRINRAIKVTKPKYNDYVPLAKVEEVITAIHQTLLPHLITTIPCHNDLHGGNRIFTGSEFKALDYGDAGPGDPYFDLATVFAPSEITPTREKFLFSTYLGRQPSAAEEAKLYLMKQVVLIKWAFDALDRLSDFPEIIRQYETIKGGKLQDEIFDLNKPEDNVKLLKILLNQIFDNFESQEFSNAIKTLSRKA